MMMMITIMIMILVFAGICILARDRLGTLHGANLSRRFRVSAPGVQFSRVVIARGIPRGKREKVPGHLYRFRVSAPAVQFSRVFPSARPTEEAGQGA